MARHLMAVCVVCILCAKHVPCKEHFQTLTNNHNNFIDKSTGLNGIENPNQKLLKDYDNVNVKNAAEKNPTSSINHDQDNDEEETFRIDYHYNKRKGRTKIFDNLINDEISYKRNKRHSIVSSSSLGGLDELELFKNGHHYHQSTTTEFLKKLFKQFGNSDGQTMNVDGFEMMLHRLGLYNLIEEKIPKNLNSNNNEGSLLKHTSSPQSHTSSSSPTTTTTISESCISSTELISRILPKQQQQQRDNNNNNNHHHHRRETTSLNEKQNRKISSKENEEDHDHDPNQHQPHQTVLNKTDVLLDSGDIFSICPILLYQLVAPTQLERTGCINSSLIPYKMYLLDEEPEEDRVYVWVYAIASVLGVSLVGLLGVAVIPCMDRHIYQHIIQFLVALAVGTLAGDALLHLLPHSMMTFSLQENGHESMIWKGLIAVLGIIFFFATERGLTMIAEWRKNIEKKEKPSSRVRVMRDPDSISINNSIGGDKLCKHKYSSYPYCYDEIAMETKDDHHHHHHHQDNTNAINLKNSTNEKTTTPVNSCNKNSIHAYRHSNDHGDNNETAQSLLQHNNYTTISDNYSVMNKEDGNNPDNNTISTNLDDTSIEGVGVGGGVGGIGVKDKPLVKEETFTIILREHESSHHGHSHKHGHVHSPPRTLSAVAWMVVMGDGLHNFTDGMAIGAAFSNNIAGGFSTAIAVFCHELPHELGDFAVLLKAGMSAKQAVYYNLLSSVLSFLGMILGVVIGDTPEASAWIFACAAGMFIYIALVDMMPELTSTHNEKCALSQCLIQLLGMSCGLGIMLLIALYEHDLKNIFSSSHDDHHNHFH